MESTNKNFNGNISFLGLLGIAFIVLKLLSVINWSWWWVLSPLYITPIIYIVLLGFALIMDTKEYLKKK